MITGKNKDPTHPKVSTGKKQRNNKKWHIIAKNSIIL
jgi:hypothetical protein